MRWEEEGRGGSGIDVVGSTYVCGSATIWMNSLINTILNHNHLHDRQRERRREESETERACAHLTVLREQTYGNGQCRAERGQTHRAVNGQHETRVLLKQGEPDIQTHTHKKCIRYWQDT